MQQQEFATFDFFFFIPMKHNHYKRPGIIQLWRPGLVPARSTIQKTELKMALGTSKTLHTIP